jgi:hypothetical protein
MVLPTAKHSVGLGQSVLRNSLCELPAGAGTIDQLPALHRSSSASGSKSPTTWKAPTARHAPGPEHATDPKLPPAALGGTPTSGLARFVHAVPLNLCIHGKETEVLLLYLPTAMHSVVLVHDTLCSPAPSLFWGTGGDAVATNDQVAPFQRSENGRGPAGVYVPIATQFVALGHDTSTSAIASCPAEPAGLGVVPIDHALPFQRSTRV